MTTEDAFSNVMLHYVESTDEAAEFVDWVKQPREIVAIDTETTGLERDARIRLIQFGDADTAWTLRWDRWKGSAIEALDILKRARQEIAFHSAPFDIPKIERQSARDKDGTRSDGHKFDFGLVHDTLVMSRLAIPLGSHTLKTLCTRYVDPRSRAMQDVLSNAMAKNGWGWETVPYSYQGYSVYAGVDTVLTARLKPKLVEKGGFNQELYQTEMACMEACLAMSEAGMEVDEEYVTQQIVQLEREIEDVVRSCHETHGFTALGSNQMLVDRLNKYGVYWDDRTETGRVSADADVLERLSVENRDTLAGDLADQALAYRTRVKLLNTFFRNFLLWSEETGRVHPDINTIEAVTGRMSVTKPAMQTLPRGPRARRAFVAGSGRYLVLADYSQIEMRLLAHFCQDPALLEAIASGDLHSATTEKIYGRVTPELRDIAKNAGFALLYGAGPEKFAQTAKISVEKAVEFLDAYHAEFTRVKPFIYQVQDVGKRRGRTEGAAYVTTPAGRKLQMRKQDAEYTLVNYLIQGSAADVLKQAIVRLWNAGFGQYMRLPVHDELVFEPTDDLDADEFKREITKHMEDHAWRVLLTVDATGPFQAWSDKYD